MVKIKSLEKFFPSLQCLCFIQVYRIYECVQVPGPDTGLKDTMVFLCFFVVFRLVQKYVETECP